MNNKITNKTINLILETTFILNGQREEAVITMRMRKKEENWMLLYSVHSSRSFLLESWTLYKSIREKIGACVCDDDEWQWNLRETLCVYYVRNIIYAQRDVTASIERCSWVNMKKRWTLGDGVRKNGVWLRIEKNSKNSYSP